MKTKIILIVTVIFVSVFHQVYGYDYDQSLQGNSFWAKSFSSDINKDIQSSALGEYVISFKLDNKSYNNLNSGWVKGRSNYTYIMAQDEDTNETVLITFGGNSKGTYRISSKNHSNLITYQKTSDNAWIAIGNTGEGIIKVTHYGSRGDFIKGTFRGIIKNNKSKHRIKGKFNVERYF